MAPNVRIFGKVAAAQRLPPRPPWGPADRATRPTPARSAVTGAQPSQPTDEGDSGALPWPPSLIRDLLVSALFKTMRLLMVLPVNAPTDWSSKTEADTDTQETHSETCSASFYSEARASRVAPFCRRPGKAPFRWTRVGLRPLRSYRKQGVGKGSLTINKYVGRRLRLLLLRTRRGQILAAVEAGVVCLGLGQVQSAAELPAFAPTGGLSYAQPSALIPHGFRQRPGVGCSPPAITDKEARRGQGGAGSRPRDIRDRCSEVLS